jgi:hypothetical protein
MNIEVLVTDSAIERWKDVKLSLASGGDRHIGWVIHAVIGLRCVVRMMRVWERAPTEEGLLGVMLLAQKLDDSVCNPMGMVEFDRDKGRPSRFPVFPSHFLHPSLNTPDHIRCLM